MPSTSAHVGDVATEIKLDTGVDLSTATDQAIYVKKPSGTTSTLSASVVETTKVKHTTAAGWFDESGIYKFHAWVEFPAGSWFGDMVAKRVSALYES